MKTIKILAKHTCIGKKRSTLLNKMRDGQTVNSYRASIIKIFGDGNPDLPLWALRFARTKGFIKLVDAKKTAKKAA